jgi:hypothetical protein
VLNNIVSKIAKYGAIVLFLLTVLWFSWWHAHNPSPDGYQNEYLHVGNAFDLWEALYLGDVWLLRWHMYTGYWPFGFYILAWPTLLFGMSYGALVCTNLWILGIIFFLFVRAKQQIPLVLLLLCPGFFGSILRYEPNLANMVFFLLGLFALQKHGFSSKKGALIWGAALGCGLMVDRLTLLFFLLPATIPLLWKASRREWNNFAWGVGLVVLLTGAYYREFFMRHLDEILPQATQGEIDSAGMIEQLENPIPMLFYPLSLIDRQAGPFIGILMIGALVALAFRRVTKKEWILLFSFVPAVLFFTLLTKKQVFYTLPALVPLSLLCAPYVRSGIAASLLGFLGFLSLGCGVGNIGSSWLPQAWVAPQHTLARPPTNERWPYKEMFTRVSKAPKEILVLSQDQQLYEGFLILRVREEFPRSKVRGVILDPIGSVEFFRDIDHFVWMGPLGKDWPTVGGIQAELIGDHYDITSLPDIAQKVVSAESSFQEIFSQNTEEGTLHLFMRIP